MKKHNCSIRNFRNEKGLSQEYVAFQLGVSQKSYSDIENGKTKMKNEMLLKIAEILEVKPSEICSISENCDCSEELHKKHTKLITYLNENNIDIPENLM
ncbi:MAG: helix-turn-helix transcriptional regulator [Lutibacter sp.]|nr:helix-turn-helix transcriptional regulator [Lutibacter sp.]